MEAKLLRCIAMIRNEGCKDTEALEPRKSTQVSDDGLPTSADRTMPVHCMQQRKTQKDGETAGRPELATDARNRQL